VLEFQKKNKESVFEEFFTTRRDMVAGGMGLPSVRQLLEIHSGSIDLLTNRKGATFLIRIPVF
jgi:signal transduction histidine kinase|tara:strand:- start:6042 stop:6230 length:189 start_codon:yes stop_codon:yes gene_type:complete